MSDTVEISREDYNLLMDAGRLLAALNAAGVDNWMGWEEAMQIYENGLTPVE